MKRSWFAGERGLYAMLAPYLVAMAVDGAVSAVGGVTVPWAAAWASVPKWADPVALMLWAAIGGVFGRRDLRELYTGHVAGIASVVSYRGLRSSHNAVPAEIFGAVFPGVVVIVIALATWMIAERVTRHKPSAASSLENDSFVYWVAFPYVVMGLRWLSLF